MAAILKMYHPEIKQTGETTQDAFDRVYQFRGWELITAAAGFAGTHLGRPVGSLEDLSGEELREAIAATGTAEVPPKNTPKAKLVKALEQAVPGGGSTEVVAVIGDTDVVDPADGKVYTADEWAAKQAADEAAAADPKSKSKNS